MTSPSNIRLSITKLSPQALDALLPGSSSITLLGRINGSNQSATFRNKNIYNYNMWRSIIATQSKSFQENAKTLRIKNFESKPKLNLHKRLQMLHHNKMEQLKLVEYLSPQLGTLQMRSINKKCHNYLSKLSKYRRNNFIQLRDLQKRRITLGSIF